MKCDKCQQEIDENKGYVTFHNHHSGTYAYRDFAGVLITKNLAIENTTTRTCHDCIMKPSLRDKHFKQV
jgi:hypothetical protein